MRIFLLLFGTILLSAQIYHVHAYSLTNISQIVGRTTIGVNKEGAVWAMYLSPSGHAKFLYSDRSVGEFRWRWSGQDTICFRSLNHNVDLCKFARPAGRGLHWWTVGDDNPSSQLLRVLEPGNWQTPLRIQSVRALVGTRIFGRLKRDNGIWSVEFREDGRFRFSRASSDAIELGNYYVSGNEICLSFDVNPGYHCRSPQYIDGRLIWSEASEIVYIETALTNNWRQSFSDGFEAFRQTRPVCSISRKEALVRSCRFIWLGGSGCQMAGDYLSGGSALPGAATGAACTAALAALEDFEITPGMLAIGALSGAFSGAATEAFNQGNYLEAFVVNRFSVGASKLGLEHCLSLVEERCRN